MVTINIYPQTQRYNAISFGSATYDMFARTQSEFIEIRHPGKRHEGVITEGHTERLIAFLAGSKIIINGLQYHVGGGGTNSAVAMSRLGLKTAYVGNIGLDHEGDMVLEALLRDNVDFLGSRSNSLTNRSVILETNNKDRTILAFKDASERLDMTNIDVSKFNTGWFYLSALDKSLLEQITTYAFEHQIKVAFNPSNYLAENGPDYIKDVLQKTNILVLNDEEAELLVGRGKAVEMIKRLSTLGPEMIVLTKGSDGTDVSYQNKLYSANIYPVEVIDTTGAGDAFASTYLAGLIKGMTIEDSLKIASLNAASVVTKIGAKSGLLKLEDLLPKKNLIEISFS